MSSEQAELPTLTLLLLDSSEGHVIQTWSFNDRARVTIGRAAENDISFADQRISRLHVELIYRDEQWVLYSRGRNGTWINGMSVSEFGLSDRCIFQLGSNGPSLQLGAANHASRSKATIDVDPGALDFLVIDELRKEQEIQQIAGSDAFQLLQQEARRLKHDNETN